MKVWGFTIVKNAVKYDYPVVESIRSILPVCDEVIVLHGDSDDETASLLSEIRSPKVRIIDSFWTPDLREGGEVLAIETNKALKLIPKGVDWCFYIQADEVLHENYISNIQKAMKEQLNNPKVNGLLFKYKHFYGSYDYVGKNSNWYTNEIRIIRKDSAIYSYRDAQGFRMNNNEKLFCKPLNAFIYHYGWVKNPQTMMEKIRDFHKLWHDDSWVDEKVGNKEAFDFKEIDVLEKFNGTHPGVMKARIKKKNWNFDYDFSKNKFSLKDRLKNMMRKLTGWTPGEYRNYKILK
jgi:hypothetical protein